MGLAKRSCRITLKGHNSTVVHIAKINGTQIVSVGQDSITNIWDYQFGMLLQSFVGEGYALKLSNNRIACGKHIYINIMYMSGQNLISLRGHSDIVACVIKLNRTQIASGSNDKSIKIWDFIKGSCLMTLMVIFIILGKLFR